MSDDQTQALAAKLLAERQRRSRRLLLGGLAAVFVVFFFCWWALTQGTSDDPLFQLQTFIEQFSDDGTSGEDYLPSPPSLPQIKRVLTPADVDAFDDGLNAFEQADYRKAGRVWWPLAAKYSNIRPSIAQEFYKVAREHSLRGDHDKTKRLLKMAFAFYDKGVRENLLAKKTYKALGDEEIAKKYGEYVRLYWPKGKRRHVDPPSPMLTFMFLFVLILGGLFAYFYWDELALAEKILFVVAKITGKASSPGQEPAGLPVETFPGEAPTPVPSAPKLEAESLNNILAAEGFLKEVRDFFDQKNYELGVDLCQKAIELNPANAKKVAQICLREGAALYELGEFSQARDLLDVSLHYDPHSAEGRTLVGNCHIKLGAYEPAKEQYEKVIAITPKNADAYYTLGVCYQKIGDLDRARRSFQVAVKLNQHVNSHFYLAKIAEAKGELDVAIKCWEDFVALAKDSPQAASALERLEKLRTLAAQQGAGSIPPE